MLDVEKNVKAGNLTKSLMVQVLKLISVSMEVNVMEDWNDIQEYQNMVKGWRYTNITIVNHRTPLVCAQSEINWIGDYYRQ